MRRNRSLSLSLSLSLLLIVLTLFSFASCNNNPGVSEGTGALTIHVSEAATKLIGFNPDGGEPLAISHYGISLKDDDGTELKKTETPIALSGGSGSFTITGLVTGNYTIDATGYVKNGDEYAEVATGTSGEIFVSPTTDTETTILIDTWKEGNTESITIDVVMPSDVLGADGNLSMDGTLKYTLTEVGTGSVTIPEKSISLTTGQTFTEGKYALTVDGDVGPGRYILSVSFTSESADKDYSNADAVLVYPGLPVTGTISIDSHSVFDEDFTVTNALGEPLTVEGDGVYSSEASTFTVTLSEALESTQKIVWYADGVALVENTGYTVAENVYTFTCVSAGEHYFVGIVYEEGKVASVGSIQLTISVAEPDFEFPSHFAYTDNGDGTCTITGENPDNPLLSHDGLVIPDEIKGLKVTVIDDGAFQGKQYSGTLVLSENIQTIKSNAFRSNSFEGNLIIPDSVVEIGSDAFRSNDFSGTLVLSSELVLIRPCAFYENSFTGNLIIPDSVTEIGESAFTNNKFDGYLLLGENLQSIGNYAFHNNKFNGSLVIPDSVTGIGDSAFGTNSFDGTLTLGNKVSVIANSAFSKNKFSGDLVIPNTVITVGNYAFQQNEFNGNLTLGNNVESIGDSAFAYNNFTGNLAIPDSVTVIKDSAFLGNAFNGTLTLGKNLQTIGSRTFAGNIFKGQSSYNMFKGSLVIPDSVISIGTMSFASNQFDGSLTLGSGLQTIENLAFQENSFAGDLLIPSSVITIKSSVFKENLFTAINCEASEQPSGWDNDWKYGCDAEVTWGYTAE